MQRMPTQTDLSKNGEFNDLCSWKVQELIISGHSWIEGCCLQGCFSLRLSALFYVDFILSSISPGLSLTGWKRALFSQAEVLKVTLTGLTWGMHVSWMLWWPERWKAWKVMRSSTQAVRSASQEPHGLRKGRVGSPKANQAPLPEERCEVPLGQNKHGNSRCPTQ